MLPHMRSSLNFLPSSQKSYKWPIIKIYQLCIIDEWNKFSATSVHLFRYKILVSMRSIFFWSAVGSVLILYDKYRLSLAVARGLSAEQRENVLLVTDTFFIDVRFSIADLSSIAPNMYPYSHTMQTVLPCVQPATGCMPSNIYIHFIIYIPVNTII